ncbi:MAG: hypothetical protein MHPSP_003037, partial [Paramarteilia canceri]
NQLIEQNRVLIVVESRCDGYAAAGSLSCGQANCQLQRSEKQYFVSFSRRNDQCQRQTMGGYSSELVQNISSSS